MIVKICRESPATPSKFHGSTNCHSGSVVVYITQKVMRDHQVEKKLEEKQEAAKASPLIVSGRAHGIWSSSQDLADCGTDT